MSLKTVKFREYRSADIKKITKPSNPSPPIIGSTDFMEEFPIDNTLFLVKIRVRHLE